MMFGSTPVASGVWAGLAEGSVTVDLLSLRVGPFDVTDYLRYRGYTVTEELNTRDTMSFDLLIPDSAGFAPLVGQEVVLFDDGVRLFAGTVNDLSVTLLVESNTTFKRYALRAVDFNQYADRRLVATSYTGQTAGAIVRDLLATYLAAEGVSEGSIGTGPTIAKAVFPYVSVARALSDICELSGYSWNIDPYKRLSFFPPTTFLSPLQFTSSNMTVRKVTRKATRDQYRNKQYVRGGQDVTSARIERLKGDGSTRTFVLTYPVAATPVITVDTTSTGSPKTVGVREVQTTEQYFYQKDDNTINQSTAETILTSTNELVVNYQGFFPIVGLDDDGALQAERAAVEGGSGIYEAVQDEPQVDDADLAMDKAVALVRRYGSIDTLLEFETDEERLVAGNQIQVNLAELGLSGLFLVTRVSYGQLHGERRRYSIRATNGELKGTFTEFWQKLADSGRLFVVRENEVIQQPVPIMDDLNVNSDLVAVEDVTYANQWPFGAGTFEDGSETIVTCYQRGFVARTTEDAYLGTYCLKIHSASSSGPDANFGGAQGAFPWLTTGILYTLSFAARRSTETTSTGTVRVSVQDGSTSESALSFNFTPTTSWGVVTRTATQDAQRTVLRLHADTALTRWLIDRAVLTDTGIAIGGAAVDTAQVGFSEVGTT